MMEKIKRFLDLADQVFQIAASNTAAEIKYELIFSAELSRALGQLFAIDYYDPDTSYEEDVAAYVGALHAKCTELRQVIA